MARAKLIGECGAALFGFLARLSFGGKLGFLFVDPFLCSAQLLAEASECHLSLGGGVLGSGAASAFGRELALQHVHVF